MLYMPSSQTLPQKSVHFVRLERRIDFNALNWWTRALKLLAPVRRRAFLSVFTSKVSVKHSGRSISGMLRLPDPRPVLH